jgi:hypothetical protein
MYRFFSCIMSSAAASLLGEVDRLNFPFIDIYGPVLTLRLGVAVCREHNVNASLLRKYWYHAQTKHD